MVRHILVGVDGSSHSRNATRFAHDLAQQTGAKVTLMFVLEQPRLVPLGPFDAFAIGRNRRTPEELDRVRGVLDEFAADLPGATVEKDVELGDPAEVLADQAERRHADLLVVGARGLGPGPRWLLGSVSDKLVHHAKCAVTVVR